MHKMLHDEEAFIGGISLEALFLQAVLLFRGEGVRDVHAWLSDIALGYMDSQALQWSFPLC